MGAGCPSGFKGEFSPTHDTPDAALPMEKITFGWMDVPMIDVDDVSSCNGAMEKSEATEKSIPLIVEDVEISSDNVEHRTSAFHCVHQGGATVMRRGAHFRVELELNRPYDPTTDILCLVFTVADANPPSYSQNTEVVLPVLKECKMERTLAEWRVRIVDSKSKTMMLEVVPSPVCVVGEWKLEVDSRSKEGSEDSPGFRCQFHSNIHILFNPWCTDDPVFLEDEERRQEFVLADSGLVYRGSHNCPRPTFWRYAQFEENILECCLHLLTSVGRLKIVDRADPVSVVRHISAVLNRHGGVREEGKPGWEAGSQDILQEFYKKKKPVKGGAQCWVRTAFFTTVCRALGIPARPVTNFCSAHETHDSLTVDRYFDSRGRPLDSLNIDALWTFHTWGEVWMSRPDLEPGGYGGWQAVDCSTDGRCGPASVCALRRGETRKPFDGEGFSAEVGARIVYWRHDGQTRPLKLVSTSTKGVGRCLLTKSVGKFEAENITHEYKQEKGSEDAAKDSEVLLRNLRRCGGGAFSRHLLNDAPRDIDFELTTLGDALIGEPITIQLRATDQRTAGQEYLVQISLNVHSTLYTGKSKKLLKRDEFEIQMGPGVENVMKMSVSYEEYSHSLLDQCAFLASASAHVQDTGFDFCAQEDLRLRMPEIDLQVEGEVVKRQPTTVTAAFTNPLPRPLNGGEFLVEGLGKSSKTKIKGSVPVGGQVKTVCILTPSTQIPEGSNALFAKFRSKDLRDVEGHRFLLFKTSAEAEKEGGCHL